MSAELFNQYGATVALAAGAGVLVLISYWWNSGSRSCDRDDDSSVAATSNGLRYTVAKETSRSAHTSSSSDLDTEAKYKQIIQDLQSQVEEERQRAQAAEKRCQRFELELDSLTSEHNALQDSHEKILKQYNALCQKYKLSGSLISLDSDIEQSQLSHGREHDFSLSDISGSGRELRNSVEDVSDVSDESLGSDELSEHSREPDFELNENVMHALIERGGVEELLQGMLSLERDDLSDLVGNNLVHDDEDIDELVSNNSKHSQEGDTHSLEEPIINVCVNEEPTRDVKSARQMWENIIKQHDSPTPPRSWHSRSRSSSHRSSPTGLHNGSFSDIENLPPEEHSGSLNPEHCVKKFDLLEGLLDDFHDNANVDNTGVSFNKLKEQWENVSQQEDGDD